MGVVDILQTDINHVGGITALWKVGQHGGRCPASRWRRTPAKGRSAGSPRSTWTPRCRTSWCRRSAAASTPEMKEKVWEEWLGFPAMRMVNGRFPLPEKPGLGFDLTRRRSDEVSVRRHQADGARLSRGRLGSGVVIRSLGGLLLAACLGYAQTADNVDFLAGLPDFAQVRTMLPEYLNRLGVAYLDQRRPPTTRADVDARRRYLRERVLRAIGGLAERTPLNARVVGRLERDGYAIEKVIFESQPAFYVTANLYLPKRGRAPYPAVLFPIGHETGAKVHGTWQQMLVTLARGGYVALAYDQLGQGERSQFFDPATKESRFGRNRSTTEHSMLGAQCLLVGDNVARYTIWDGIRALDYLLSRPEVDGSRIAVTGNSGGGTHTAYLAALDDRIHVAAPSCYLTSWRRLLETIGPQDAEQCMPPFLADGLDHADFVHAFAPKPYLILSAIRDFFSITGARATYAEARGVYNALDASAKLSMVEADDGHGYTQPRRVAAYAWLDRWLRGGASSEPETPVTPESEETLYCTTTGQVSTSLGGETVFTLNRKRLPSTASTRVLDEARRLSGYAPQSSPLNVQSFGSIDRDGYRIEKLIYDSEPGILIPALLFVPRDAPGPAPAIVYVHGRGKSAAAAAGGDIEQLVRAGAIVLAIDSRGMGETAISRPQQASINYFGDDASAMKALLAGRTLTGMRAADVSRGVDLLAARREVDRARISGYGKEAGAVVLLHAAAFDDRIRRVVLEEMLLSYRAVVETPIHRGIMESVIPGVLRAYDLPSLTAALSPRAVWVANSLDAAGARVTLDQMNAVYKGVKVLERRPEESVAVVYREMFQR